MGFSASFPEALPLLLLLPPLWLMALRRPRRLEGRCLWASLGLRSALTCCLALAVAGAQLRLPAEQVTTVFLVDGSDSVDAGQRSRAESFVRDALRAMRPDDRAGVVVFGRDALVARAPDGAWLGDRAARPAGAATDIAAAMQLGLALLPGEGHRRLVLLSDGVQTMGDALAAARAAAMRGVPVDVVSLGRPAGALDAQISAAELPAVARAGQRLRMRVRVASTAPAAGRVVVTGAGGEQLAAQPVALRAGSQELEIELPEAAPDFNRYQVRLELPGDERPENNAADTFTVVADRPRVLLVADEPEVARHLERALAAAQVSATTVKAASIPATLDELALYDAVMLIDVPRHAVADAAVETLGRYVRELGHGLMMVGGPSSFGAGGWRGSPLEDVLPVTMDTRSKIEQPPASVVLLVDISGSMSEIESGRTKLSLAVEGAQQIAGLLRDEDELTVIPFDHEPVNVVGPVAGRERAQAVEALGQVTFGGGGINIRDGLTAAAEYVRRSDRPVRHIITLTDGDDTAQQEGALAIVERLRAEDVTLSSIAIGDGDHIPFIKGMARTGAGRYFFTDRASSLPAIMVNEAREVMQPYLVEAPFTPALAAPSPIVRALPAAPELRGFVQTTARQTAQVILATPDGQPLLASWQYGLGHALVWTSDMSSRWAADWVRWEGFPELAGQLVAAMLPPPGSKQLALRSEMRGGELVLRAQARDAVASARDGLRLAAQLVGPDGDSRAVPLREVAPGAYEAATVAPPGAYEVRLVALDRAGLPVDSLIGGAVAPSGGEYRGARGDELLLRALAAAGGGRVGPAAAAAFAPTLTAGGAPRDLGGALLWLALLLLPLDVAVRRQLLDREALAELAQAARRRSSIHEGHEAHGAGYRAGNDTCPVEATFAPFVERRGRRDEAA